MKRLLHTLFSFFFCKSALFLGERGADLPLTADVSVPRFFAVIVGIKKNVFLPHIYKEIVDATSVRKCDYK